MNPMGKSQTTSGDQAPAVIAGRDAKIKYVNKTINKTSWVSDLLSSRRTQLLLLNVLVIILLGVLFAQRQVHAPSLVVFLGLLLVIDVVVLLLVKLRS